MNPDQFSGHDRVTKADVRTLNGNLNLAYAPDARWSFGIGVDALFANVELHSVVDSILPGGGGDKVNIANVMLKSSYRAGLTWNAGGLWTPNPEWKIAVNYRAQSHVKVDDGEATFSQILTGFPQYDAAVRAKLPVNQTVTSELRFPSILSLGAAWNPAPDWTWEMDANKTGWSWFQKLALTFPQNHALDKTITEDYQDSWRVNVGAEHRLPKFTYRFGYYFDQAAAPTESVTPLLPDANRHGATVGLGFKLGRNKAWTLDLYNMALFVESRSTDGRNRDGYNGTYKSYVNAAGVNLGYHW
jgi:long-chain fatty acid transport protein